MTYDSTGFNWPQYKDQLNKLVHDTSAEIRVIRPLLTLHGKQGGFTTVSIGHKVDSGPPLTVSTTQNFSPVTLRCKWQIASTQYTDEDAMNCLAVEAAYRVAAAEEAVILLGNGAAEFLKSLGVEADNLNLQEALLPPTTGPVASPILDSIIQGITELGTNAKNRRLRNYVVIVSLDLYGEAFRNRTNPFDAPIHEIRPLLTKDGFLYSQALPPKTGLLLSLSGQPIKLAVPVDAQVCAADPDSSGTVTLRVEQQIRLLIDVPEAVVALRDAE